MEEILETLYAKDITPKDPNCKTCKNKPKFQRSGMFWIAIWMMIMAFYGNFILFKQIFNFIF
jgi:hypothetical protein